ARVLRARSWRSAGAQVLALASPLMAASRPLARRRLRVSSRARAVPARERASTPLGELQLSLLAQISPQAYPWRSTARAAATASTAQAASRPSASLPSQERVRQRWVPRPPETRRWCFPAERRGGQDRSDDRPYAVRLALRRSKMGRLAPPAQPPS